MCPWPGANRHPVHFCHSASKCDYTAYLVKMLDAEGSDLYAIVVREERLGSHPGPERPTQGLTSSDVLFERCGRLLGKEARFCKVSRRALCFRARTGGNWWWAQSIEELSHRGRDRRREHAVAILLRFVDQGHDGQAAPHPCYHRCKGAPFSSGGRSHQKILREGENQQGNWPRRVRRSACCIIHFRPRWRSRRRSGARTRANKRVGGFKASQPTWCGSWPFVSVGMKGDLAHTNHSNAASPSGTTGHLR